MNPEEATARWTELAVYLAVIFLVLGMVTAWVWSGVRRRMLSGSKRSDYDPFADLLNQNKGIMTEEELRLLRRKMAEKLVGENLPEGKE